MIDHQFDDMARAWSATRRSLMSGGIASAAGWLGVFSVFAKNTDKTKRKKGKKRKTKNGREQNQQQDPPVDTPLPPPPGCTPACGARTCGDDGCGGSCGVCGPNQVCEGGSCVCAPEPPATTCAGQCGTKTNICGQPVACACPSGRACLSNGTCAIVCDDDADCSGSCDGCSNPNIEGATHCAINAATDEPCTSTAHCPPGTHCQHLGGVVTRCVRLCT